MFPVRGFEWDTGNAEKNLLKHSVTTGETEEAFFTDPLILRVKKNLYYIFSVTLGGRYLFGVFVLKPGRIVRVISIRDMEKKDRSLYKEKKGR
ncbi:MAG: BrnT family toxin [Candidatus Eremiobacteraeota bacterium]|nr:BrnT family toxin [Candidatus Eremiobacteraeota bacterium]